MTPTARSLAELKRRGHAAQVVERWNSFAKRRVDLFGVIDIVYMADVIVGVQATSDNTGGNSSARMAKILAEPRALKWIQAGGRLEIWSWSKRGARGKRKTWTLRTVAVTADMFPASLSSGSQQPVFRPTSEAA